MSESGALLARTRQVGEEAMALLKLRSTALSRDASLTSNVTTLYEAQRGRQSFYAK